MLSMPQENTEPVLDVDYSIPVPFLMVCLLAHLLSLAFSITHSLRFLVWDTVAFGLRL